ncbi:adenine phosphoribosyltransferase-like [Adelges cooleyi]|uniref:adenine phosphoribosyltransferase-like n=1 Tax=Adelges cooleyi TaxID=133065 RepID=UPI0021806FFB|nr:adenine phosphoribosyltransferase-like [Adelges cooleyi]XP_050440938.1 adenine phosphoribosyltransferase-like [Adelges cooleyi]XP_050440939.1 adenine phosphoribosyltransferase-like [Adelges cooleyi]XP_050440940.1 adenine phosphoribosyltransferase-like [Adelges cooleyi]XP_050440941.1 adenine phosphoribosyltransferase-like [Adelges cooleyi]XP_050440942.1 adenine phosphoribosyltransferase-like [Adelges cooleyi]
MATTSNSEEDIACLKSYIKSYPDFPIPGILYRDIFSVLKSNDGLQLLNKILKNYAVELNGKIDCVAMLEARGFLLGTLMAVHLNVPCVPIRKKGKLPGRVEQLEYTLEYGKDVLEVQLDGIQAGQRVLIIDDLLATGGTLKAAIELLQKAGAQATQALVVIELCDLEGRKKVDIPVKSFVQY